MSRFRNLSQTIWHCRSCSAEHNWQSLFLGPNCMYLSIVTSAPCQNIKLLRTIGFSSSPELLRVLGIIPFFYGIIFLITGIWMLVAMVIAVRQALDYNSTLRAVGVCIIGWIIQGLIFALILILPKGYYLKKNEKEFEEFANTKKLIPFIY